MKKEPNIFERQDTRHNLRVKKNRTTLFKTYFSYAELFEGALYGLNPTCSLREKRPRQKSARKSFLEIQAESQEISRENFEAERHFLQIRFTARY